MVLTQHTPAGRPAWLLPLIVGGIALIGIVVAYFVISSSSDATDASDSNQDDGDVVDVVEQDEDDQLISAMSNNAMPRIRWPLARWMRRSPWWCFLIISARF